MSRRVAARLTTVAACLTGALLGCGQAVAAAPPTLSVTGAALYAPATGQVLYGVNRHRHLAIASTTKLMTALVTLQRIHHLSTVYSQNDWYPAPDDSQLGLVPGDRMSVHDLLIAMLLPSADDAAEDLAYNVGGGSVSRFIAMMNRDARALHLRDTHYSTPIGLDTPGNYSSAYDLVHLAAYDLSHSPYFARVVALRGATVRVNGVPRWVPNLNNLVGRYRWIDGVKTGNTTDAGHVLVAAARRHGLRLISAVLGTSSRASADHNTLALLDWGYRQFRTWTPVKRGQVLARRRVAGVRGLRVPLVAKQGFVRVLRRSSRVHVVVRAPRVLRGPLRARRAVGTAVVFDGRRVLARIMLLVKVKVPAPRPASGAGQPTTTPTATTPTATTPTATTPTATTPTTTAQTASATGSPVTGRLAASRLATERRAGVVP